MVWRRKEGEHFPNIAQYFAGERKLKELMIPAQTQDGVRLIPADPFLTLRDLGGSGRPDVETAFVRDVRGLGMLAAGSSDAPDWIIIDTPLAMSVFTRAGLAAADYVLAPVRPRQASLAGTRNMLRTLRTMNALMGVHSTFLGTVITHWDKLRLTQEFEDIDLPAALKEFEELGAQGAQAFKARIPLDNQLDTLEPGAKIKGAEAYEALAEELLQNVHQRRSRHDG